MYVDLRTSEVRQEVLAAAQEIPRASCDHLQT